MKYVWILYLTAFASFQLANAQFNFKQHKIEKGEDVYSIAQLYGTTPSAIYNLNPTAKAGINPGEFLVLPNVILPPELPVAGIEFKKHKTKKKETLYSIARKYKVSQEAIKKHNVFLETNPLRKGDILKIPLPAPKVNKVVRQLGANKDAVLTSNTSKESKANATQIYTVKPKETRYGIARKFGITIPELENMNPNLGKDFPIGIQILVPAKISDTSTTEKQFQLYKVKPKQTLYSLSKEYKIEIDSIVALNPLVKEGLKEGMILKLPGEDINQEEFSELEIVDLKAKISNTSQKNIALLLPFNVDKVNFEDEEQIKSHLNNNRVVRLTVDFYSGVLMAVEEAAKLNIPVNLNVYDTKNDIATVTKLVVEKDVANNDAVIGPLYQKNVERVASLLNKAETPVFSPISKKVNAISNNLFQTLPTKQILEDKIISYAKRDTLPKNIIVIADRLHQTNKKKLVKAFPEAKILNPEDDNFIKIEDFEKVIGEEESSVLPTWVFLESSSLVLSSNVISFLNSKAKTHKITLFTTDKTSVYDNESISNMNLSNLNFHYPSVHKNIEETETEFHRAYEVKYGQTPNQYAVRGYDLAYDLILRLAASENVFKSCKNSYTTEYLENKFNYKVSSSSGKGFVNNACYIMSYQKDLTFKLVE